MKTILNFGDFKKALKEVEKLSSKTLNPILDNVYLMAEENKLTLRKDNCDIQLNISVDADTEEVGNTILLKSTSKLLKNIKKNSEMVIDDNIIKLESKEIKFAEIEDEYPDIKYELQEKNFEVTQKELLRMISCSYCMTTDNCRPILQGVNINNNKFCALDGYRVSVRESEEFTSDLNVTIPSEAVKLLEKLLDNKSEGIVEIYSEKNFIRFKFDNVDLIIKLLEGEYIKYESLIPSEHDMLTTIEVEDVGLKDKLTLVNKSIENKIVKLHIGNDKVGFKSRDIENEIKDTIECKEIKGNELEIWFNCKYALEAIKQYDNNFRMYFSSSVNPIIITNDYKNLEMVLPVRKTN